MGVVTLAVGLRTVVLLRPVAGYQEILLMLAPGALVPPLSWTMDGEQIAMLLPASTVRLQVD